MKKNKAILLSVVFMFIISSCSTFSFYRVPVTQGNLYDEEDLNKLEIGKILTIKVNVLKYNFPRIRNLPNKVVCEKNGAKIDCIFFNSYEGYIKKILPLGKEITVSGKIGHFRNKYQITNPKYVSEDSSLIKQTHNLSLIHI